MQFIFFANLAKPSSMRRAVAAHLCRTDSVVVVSEAISIIRSPFKAPMSRRATGRLTQGAIVKYQPPHWPARVPLLGPWLQRLNERQLCEELLSIAGQLPSGRRIVFYDSPSQHPLVGRLGESLSVYLAIDDRTVTVTGEEIVGERAAELRLLKSVDQVICVSAPLAEVLRSRASDRPDLRIDVLTNGYDDELFSPDAAPREPLALTDVPRPRILVAGHVSDRIDWTGISRCAARRPDVAWVFVGPDDAGMTEQIAAIRAESGADLRLFPPVVHAEIPAWIAHADVCASPYRLNSFTRASSPLKVVEYLGAGAPTITTHVSALEPFSEVVHWLEEGDGNSYQLALERALAEGRSAEKRAARTAAVRPHSWARKSEELRRLLVAP